ncbi:adenosylcobinamide-GDP ribazoletransferase [Atopomonas sediminilitoris]|uniref:adenosylcobinamide-GDP ribazoletransferase n=1 Tax=Atopomonas sediminilitoris TaxID=2919919 RepID=UPI001F4EC499|nr:adenosylcobinamide-GDP ribazoletransferase [Atopomonas sediminilitoris]MCJ8170183.1 adenosylcobinamide-GDP ribazoletransferase [Atopomonas sediminilitoris]
MRQALIALQFLTALPVHLANPPTLREQGQSLVLYPWVGVLIGALLVTAHALLQAAAPALQAALLLALWVALTGALHLDGLADSADGWLGGLGNRERTLEIMRDPRCGSAAVVTLVVVLLLKWVALWTLLQGPLPVWPALLAAPLLTRAGLPLLLLRTANARPDGLADQLRQHAPASLCRVSAYAGLVLACALLFGAWTALLATAASAYLLRRAMLKRLGGLTGDTAGAWVELLECVLLVGLALA